MNSSKTEALTINLHAKNQTMPKGLYKVKSLKIEPQQNLPKIPKPTWIKAKTLKAKDYQKIANLKSLLHEQQLHSVCEEASCPNLGECFSHGTATFMILGDICTRKCTFCNVQYGRPKKINAEEPNKIANAVLKMMLKYVVITSVDRDDLRDKGANHFAKCIAKIREKSPKTKIEILTPDFRGAIENAITILQQQPADIFNHNLETVPNLYSIVRPFASYQGSLDLLKLHKNNMPQVPTKSGIMLGLGETLEQVYSLLYDLRRHEINMLTIGQYLQPSPYHLQVQKYYSPDEFLALKEYAENLGFDNVAAGPLVRSSYHADLQAK